jgi:hypothetical protein
LTHDLDIRRRHHVVVIHRVDKEGFANEHLTTATTMYREMDMRFYLEQAETAIKESG